jgi:hypothetical protein
MGTPILLTTTRMNTVTSTHLILLLTCKTLMSLSSSIQISTLTGLMLAWVAISICRFTPASSERHNLEFQTRVTETADALLAFSLALAR